MVGRTVESVAEALFRLELSRASWAAPRHKSWRDVDVFFQLVRVPVELFDKIERSLVVGTVPEFYIDHIFFLLHSEFCRERSCLHRLRKLDEALTLAFADEHRWDTQTQACSIVAHDNILDILLIIVNHNK